MGRQRWEALAVKIRRDGDVLERGPKFIPDLDVDGGIHLLAN
jgi:hypothetical protein